VVEHIRYNASDNPLIEKDFISHLNSSQAEFQIIVLRGLGQIKVENFNRITKLITGTSGLNDDGDESDIKSIEKEVAGFKEWLVSDESQRTTHAYPVVSQGT